jgi:hypothetical protein
MFPPGWAAAGHAANVAATASAASSPRRGMVSGRKSMRLNTLERDNANAKQAVTTSAHHVNIGLIPLIS